jgi:hypothetical protein
MINDLIIFLTQYFQRKISGQMVKISPFSPKVKNLIFKKKFF